MTNEINTNELDTNKLDTSKEEKVPVNDSARSTTKNTKDSYEGRKHDPEIDGPMQDSQETDEIYADPRKQEDIPAGGKNVGDLNVNDLSQNNDT